MKDKLVKKTHNSASFASMNRLLIKSKECIRLMYYIP